MPASSNPRDTIWKPTGTPSFVMAPGVDQAGQHRTILGGARGIGLLVRDRAFDGAKRHPVERRLVEAGRQGDVEQLGARAGERLGGAVERPANVVVDPVEIDRSAD